MKVKTLMNILEDMGEDREVVVLRLLPDQPEGDDDLFEIKEAKIVDGVVVIELGEAVRT